MWDFGIINPSCAPGFGGMVGGSTTLMPTGVASFTEYYVVPDEDPAGWVYFGGTSNTYRIPKAGGAVEDVEALAGARDILGAGLHTGGRWQLNVFTVDSALSTVATGRLYRITSDGGMPRGSWRTSRSSRLIRADDFRTAVVQP